MITNTLIAAAKSSDIVKFKEKFTEAVAAKILERIAEKRKELADSI